MISEVRSDVSCETDVFSCIVPWSASVYPVFRRTTPNERLPVRPAGQQCHRCRLQSYSRRRLQELNMAYEVQDREVTAEEKCLSS